MPSFAAIGATAAGPIAGADARRCSPMRCRRSIAAAASGRSRRRSRSAQARRPGPASHSDRRAAAVVRHADEGVAAEPPVAGFVDDLEPAARDLAHVLARPARPAPRGAAHGPADAGWPRRARRRWPAPRRSVSGGRRSSPAVSVPVLSNTTVSTSASRSSAVGGLEQDARRNRRPVAATCTAGTASASAHGQVMMSTATAISSAGCQRAPPSKQPAEERQQRHRMHRRRIEARHPVGERDDSGRAAARPPPSAGRSRRAGCAAGWRVDSHAQRRVEVDACRQRPRSPASRAAGAVSPVIRLLSRARRRRSDHGRRRRCARRPRPARACRAATDAGGTRRAVRAVGVDHAWRRRRCRPSRLLGRGRARGAHALVEKAADQQEEQQRDGGSRNRHARCRAKVSYRLMPVREDDAERDRHVHVGAPRSQRRAGGAEERLARIGDGRHRDQRREPVEQVARAGRHVARRGPAHTETESSMMLAAAKPATARRAAAPARPVVRRIAARRHRTAPAGSRDARCASISRHRRRRRRRARRASARRVDRLTRAWRRLARAQAPLDQPDAGAAMQPLDHQRQSADAVAVRATHARGVGVDRRSPAAGPRAIPACARAHSSGRGPGLDQLERRWRSRGSRTARAWTGRRNGGRPRSSRLHEHRSPRRQRVASRHQPQSHWPAPA